MSSTNNASSSKPRNPLEELPLPPYTRPASSHASSSASSSRTTPSSVSSLLSSGSRSSTGSQTGSTRIVDLPLSSSSQDASSSRTVRPSGAPPSPSARRWLSSANRHARGSSLSVLQTSTPGRLHSGMLHSSPLNPRALAGTPSTEERRTARRLMMDETNSGMMDVDEEPVEEDRTLRRRSIGSIRDRDREMMPPPEVPISALASPSLTPERSPARRLFVVPTTDTPPRPTTAERSGSLQPSPPLPPNASVTPASPLVDSDESGSVAATTKPRARTSTGRESPCSQPITEVVVDGSTRVESGEEVAKKVRLQGKDSNGKGKQRMDFEDLPTPSSTEEEERLDRQRMENADPHDCGFSVWEDLNRPGPSSLRSQPSTSQLGTSSSASNSTTDSPSSMSEKNKKAMAWLTIPFDNQENVKPPPENRMVPFILDTKKGKSEAPSGFGTSSASGSSKAGGSAKAASSSTHASTAAVVTSGRVPPPIRPASTTSTRNEVSIRTTMRGSIAPISTTVGGLRGPESFSPVKAAGSGHNSQPVERASPVLKLRRGPSSVPSLRGNAIGPATVAPVRPVLVLRRTGSAENVNTISTNSPGSRTAESIQEQENEVFPISVIDPLKVETTADKPKAKPGRKKRKSDEMNRSSDGSNDIAKKRPPTRSTAGTIHSSSPDQPRGGERTRRSLGSSTGSDKKTGKAAGDGYMGRVLRSMTRAGNGL